MNDLRVTINDVRRAGMCARGARRWCEAYDIDFKLFLKEGISAARLEQIDDPFARRALVSARQAAARKV